MKEIPIKSKIEPGQLFKISRMKEIIKPTKPHKHTDYHEIIVLTEGAGSHNIDNTEHEVLPPVIYLLKPGQVHCWNFTRIPKGFVILFREELLQPYHTSRLLYQLPKMIRAAKDDQIFSITETLYREFKAHPHSREVIEAYLHLLLVKLSKIDAVKSEPIDSLIYHYKRMIDSSYKELKQVKDYAEKLHVTPHKLNETSKKILGKTASDLIREKILIESKVLLSHTNKSVSEIAFELEFTDASNFIKFFKSQTNITPRKYRELL